MGDRFVSWWPGIPVLLSLVLDGTLVVVPPGWVGGLAVLSAVALVVGVVGASWVVTQRRKADQARRDQRKERLAYLAEALVKFSSGDLTIRTKGQPSQDPLVEACIAEFNDITSEPCRRTFYVGSDSLVEGTMAGKTIGQRFPRGKLAVFVGSLDGVNFQLRRKGALAELKAIAPEVKEVKVIESRVDPTWAYQQTKDLLAAEPGIGAIYVTEGGSPAGVARAVADSGKAGKVQVFAHDVTPDTMDAMEKGWITATIFQDPFAQGYDPVVRLFNLLGTGRTPSSTRYVTKIRSVTPENSSEFWDSRLKKSRPGDLGRLEAPGTPAGVRPRIAVVGLANDGFWAEVKAGALAAKAALEPLGGTVDWFVPEGADEPARIANLGKLVRTVMTSGYGGLAVPLHSRDHVAVVNEAITGGLTVATYNAEPLSFRQTLTTIADQARLQRSLSRDLDDQVARGQTSADLIGDSLVKVIEGLEKQKQQVDQTGTDLEALGKTLETIDTAARTSADASTQAVQAANDSFLAVKDTLTAMGSLEDSSKAIARSVEELRSETSRIAENVSFIGDIANQTNTLAINASIEAARNGIAGKGFAVIASEIRSLSDQANRAAESISTLLQSVEAKVVLVEANTRASVDETRRTHGLATRSEAALGVIQHSAQENGILMNEILGGVDQVLEFRSQISGIVATLQKTNEDWNHAVEGSRVATGDMTRAVGAIAEGARTLLERSESQEGMLRQFKLDAD